MVKAELHRLGELGRREGRRQVSARWVRARRRSELGSGFAWIKKNRVPVIARIDAQLRLDSQHRGLSERISRALTEEKIGFWWLPGAERSRRTLGLRSEDRPAVLDVIKQIAGPSWYADVLDPMGRRSGRLLAASSLPGSVASSAPGLQLWEYVAATPESGLVADEHQGVAIHFWATGRSDEAAGDEALGAEEAPGEEAGESTRTVADDRPVLRAEVANLVATVLDPVDCMGFGEVPAPLRSRQIGVVDFPIDVVYTWVDGADPAWLQIKARAVGSADDQAFTERAQDESRFADHDELRYSLRALEQFAPWVNHVWIVTADQHPAWLRRDDPWISVVDHHDIFPDQDGLPTFNSHAIEACLHRIPGLSEHFLYLNDDMILGCPVNPEQFFHPSGIGKFFYSRALVDYRQNVAGEIASSTAAKNARTLLAERYGVTFARKFYHTAAALHVSELSRLESEFAEVFAATRRAKFRTVHDIAVAGSFYLNYGYLVGTLTPGRLAYDYVDPAAPDAEWRLRRLRKRTFDAFCINDGSSAETEQQRRRTDQTIRRFLSDYLPVPGAFEL